MILKTLIASSIMSSNKPETITVNQYDRDEKEVRVSCQGIDLTGMYAVAEGVKPDDKYIYNKTRIEDGAILTAITLQMTAAPGKYDIQLDIFRSSDNGRAGIYLFTLDVVEAKIHDPLIVSTDEYTALTDIEGDVLDQVKVYIDATYKASDFLYYKEASEAAAENAESASTSAAESATSASGSATTATTKASESSESAAAALQSEESASTSATAAESAQTAAETARTGAQTAETNACNYSTSAGNSATAAAGSATDAQSAQTATESAMDAAAAAKTAAETARDSASSSKTAAATSESNAASSAAAASTSADNASTSATAAASSASEAATSASAAASSASASTSSASAADAAKTAAASSASAAATSEANAAYSAQAAANSAASLVVVNDLTTGGTNNALSAEQGKVLNASINTLTSTTVNFSAEQSLTTAQRYQARKNIGAAAVVDIKDAYELQEAVRQGRANQILSVGDFFTVGRGGTDWLFQAAAFDYDVPVKTQYTHSMRLLMYPCFGNVAFDAQEAIYYAAAELAAGTYWFVDSRANKYCSFTTTTAVPAGGQIVLAYVASPNYTITSAKTYASQTSTTALETATVTVSDTTPAAGTQLTPVNDGNRARFGNNNWMQSAIRQWLNSAATTGWWTPKNNYDRPQSSPTDGFLNGIDADLLACIGKVRLRTGLNSVDNAGTFGYSDNEELIFLPSRTEMGLGNSVTNIYETPVAADGTAKTTTMPLFTDNASRIKYLAGVARSWWMRSPSPSATSASSTYFVNTDGSLNGSGALGGYGAVPACVIY